MSGHPLIPLKDLVKEVQAGFASGENVPEGTIQVRMNNVDTSGHLSFDSVRRVPTTLKQLDKYSLTPGDILFNNTNSCELVGKSALFEGLDEDVVFSNHFTRIRTNSEKLYNKYLAHYLITLWRRGVFMRLCNRWVNQASVRKEVLLSLAVPIPPLSEQKRIVAVLDKVDALHYKQQHTQLIDHFLRSTFIDMFGDPATNPKKFPIKRLSEFYISPSEGTKCGPFGSALKKSELVEAGVPVWNMDNISPSGRMVLPFRMWVTMDKYRELEKYSVIDGDIIISRAGTVGKMCVALLPAPPSIISTNLIRLRLCQDLLPIYFVSLMTYCKGRVGRLKTGEDGALTHMSTGVLDNLKFPYPPLELQMRFASIVRQTERMRANNQKRMSELNKLFGALQYNSFGAES